MSSEATKPSAWVTNLAGRKLGVQEVLGELARSRTVAVKSEYERSSRAKPAYRTDGNAEFEEPRSVEQISTKLKFAPAAISAPHR
jgi:hypothetical protein